MADIKTKLTLDNSQFNRNAKESTRLTSGLKAGLSGLGSAAKFAAVTLTAATASLAFFVTRSVQTIDRLGKVSKTTGFAAETLQKFQFAAEQSGVSADQAAVALRRFSRRFGEAAKGTGELLPALKRLGIETRNVDGQVKSAEEILFEFADGIKNAKNESDALSLAFKAFDSEGAELVETLRDGSDGLRAFFNEAEALGFILSTNSISGVEAFADEFNRLQAIVGGLINQFTAALAPTLEDITRTFRQFISEQINAAGGLEEFGKYLKDKFIDILATVILSLEKIFNTLVDIGNAIVTALRLFASLFGVELFPQLASDADKANKSVGDLTDTIKGGLLGSIAMTPAGRGVLGALGLTSAGIDAFADQLENIATGDTLFQRTTAGTDFVDMLLGNKEDAKEKVEEIIEEVIVTGKKIPKSLGDKILDALFGVARVDEFFVEYAAAGEKAMNKIAAVAKLVLGEELIATIQDAFANSDVGDFTKTLADGLVKSAQMFEDTLAEAFVNGKADFSDLADFIKITLAKAFIQKTITGPLMMLFGLASGGPAKAGQPYIVGEEGPELFIPNNSGTVIPNDITEAMAGGPAFGGGGGMVTYNINAVDAPSFQALVASDPQFIYAVTQAGARTIPGSR